MIIVTGAAGAVGRAVVAKLAGAGLPVTGIDLTTDRPAVGEFHFVGGVDLTDGNAVEAAITGVRGLGRPISGLVNVAGGFRWETLGDGSAATWDFLYRMNLLTAVNACLATLPALREGGGAIVNVGAAATLKAAAGMGAYTASKSGVARLTESLADEEKRHHVRVNAVLPSIVDTPANRADMPDADHKDWVAPDALADVIAFLLSDAARAVTGALVPVMGRI